MDWVVTVCLLFAVVLFFVWLGAWVFLALFIAGFVGLLLTSNPSSFIHASSPILVTSLDNYSLTNAPLFILMGQLLLVSGISTTFYDGVTRLVRGQHGAVLYANVLGAAIFATVSGSSVATASALGSVAIPEIRARGYDAKIGLGSLAAGGTLGILIPPSVAMIIYANASGASIADLFFAGFVPGIIAVVVFLIYVAIRIKRNPALGGPPDDIAENARQGLGEDIRYRFSGVVRISPILLLLVLVLGSMYSGLATPTDAAAVGAVVAFVIGATIGHYRWADLKLAFRRTVSITGMIGALVISAQLFQYALVSTGATRGIVDWLSTLDLPRWGLMAILGVMFLFLGDFLDSISMILITVPILSSVFLRMHMDLVWVGILVVIFVEVGQVTPPIGLNTFVIQTIDRLTPLGDVVRGSLPFAALLVVVAVLVYIFPELALWLPHHMAKAQT